MPTPSARASLFFSKSRSRSTLSTVLSRKYSEIARNLFKKQPGLKRSDFLKMQLSLKREHHFGGSEPTKNDQKSSTFKGGIKTVTKSDVGERRGSFLRN